MPTQTDLRSLSTERFYKNLNDENDLYSFLTDTPVQTGLNGTGTTVCDITDRLGIGFRHLIGVETNFRDDDDNTDIEKIFVDDVNVIELVDASSSSYLTDASIVIQVESTEEQYDLYDSSTRNIKLEYTSYGDFDVHKHRSRNHRFNHRDEGSFPSSETGIVYGYDYDWNNDSLAASKQPRLQDASSGRLYWQDLSTTSKPEDQWAVSFNSETIDWDGNNDLIDFTHGVVRLTYTSSNDEIVKTLTVDGVDSTDLTSYPLYNQDLSATSIASFFSGIDYHKILHRAALEIFIGDNSGSNPTNGSYTNGSYHFGEVTGDVNADEISLSTALSNYNDLANQADDETWHGADIDFDISAGRIIQSEIEIIQGGIQQVSESSIWGFFVSSPTYLNYNGSKAFDISKGEFGSYWAPDDTPVTNNRLYNEFASGASAPYNYNKNTNVSGIGNIGGEWIQVEFLNAEIVNTIDIESAKLREITIVGSNNGSTWTSLLRTNITTPSSGVAPYSNAATNWNKRLVTFSNNTAYKYYRIIVENLNKNLGLQQNSFRIYDIIFQNDSTVLNDQVTQTNSLLPPNVEILDTYVERLDVSAYDSDYIITLDSTSRERVEVTHSGLVISEQSGDESVSVLDGSGNEVAEIDILYGDGGLTGSDLTLSDPSHTLLYEIAPTTLNWSDQDRRDFRSTYRALDGNGIEWHYFEDPSGFSFLPTFSTTSAPTDAFVVIVESTTTLTDDTVVFDVSGNSMVSADLVSVANNHDRTVRINVTGSNLTLPNQSDHLLKITFTDPEEKLNTFTFDASDVEFITIPGETKFTNYIDSGVFKGDSLVDVSNKSFEVTINWVGQSSTPSTVLEHRPYTVTLCYGDECVTVPQTEISESTDYTFTTVMEDNPFSADKKPTYTYPPRFDNHRITENTRTTTFSNYDVGVVLPGFGKVKLRLSNLVFTHKTYSLEFYDFTQEEWFPQNNSKLQYFTVEGSDIKHTRTVDFDNNTYGSNLNRLVGFPVTLTFTDNTYKSARIDFYSESDLATSLGHTFHDHRDTRGDDLFVSGVGNFLVEHNFGHDFTANAGDEYSIRLATDDDSTILSAHLYLFSNGTLIPRQVLDVSDNEGIMTIYDFGYLDYHRSERSLNVTAVRDDGDQLSQQSRLKITVSDPESSFVAEFFTEENWNMRGMALYYNPGLIVQFDGFRQSLAVDGNLKDLYLDESIYPGIKVKHSDTQALRDFLKLNVNSTDYLTELRLLPDQFSAILATGVEESLKDIDVNVLFFGDGYDLSNHVTQPLRFTSDFRGYTNGTYTLAREVASMLITSLDKDGNELSQTVSDLYAGKTFPVTLTRTGVSIDFIKEVETTVSNLARDSSGNPIHASWRHSITPATVHIRLRSPLGSLAYLASQFTNLTLGSDSLHHTTTLKHLPDIRARLSNDIRIKRFVLGEPVVYGVVFEKNDVSVDFSALTDDVNDVTTTLSSRSYNALNGIITLGSNAIPQEEFFTREGGVQILHSSYSFSEDAWNNNSYVVYMVHLPGMHYSSSYSKDLSLPVNITTDKIYEYKFLPTNGEDFGSNIFGNDGSNVPEHTITRLNNNLLTPLQVRDAESSDEHTIKMTSNKIKITQRSPSGSTDVWYGYLESIIPLRTSLDDTTFYNSNTTGNTNVLKTGFPQNTESNNINIVFAFQQNNTPILTVPRGVTLPDDVYNLTLQFKNDIVIYDVTDVSTGVLEAKLQNSDTNSALTVDTSVFTYNNFENGAFKFAGFQGYQIGLTPEISNEFKIYFIEESENGRTTETRTVYKVTCSDLNLAAITLAYYFQPYATGIDYLDSSGNWVSLDPSDNLVNILDTSVDFVVRLDDDTRKNAFLRTFMATVNNPNRYVAIENKDILCVKDCHDNEVLSIGGGGIISSPYAVFNRIKVTGNQTDHIIISHDESLKNSYHDLL